MSKGAARDSVVAAILEKVDKQAKQSGSSVKKIPQFVVSYVEDLYLRIPVRKMGTGLCLRESG